MNDQQWDGLLSLLRLYGEIAEDDERRLDHDPIVQGRTYHPLAVRTKITHLSKDIQERISKATV